MPKRLVCKDTIFKHGLVYAIVEKWDDTYNLWICRYLHTNAIFYASDTYIYDNIIM